MLRLALIVIAVAACKGKSTVAEPPPAGSATTMPGSGSTALGSGSAAHTGSARTPPSTEPCTSGKDCVEQAHELEEAGDVEAAARVLRRGCEVHRDGESCFTLGNLLHGTRGIPADHTEEQRLFETGCELGFPDACSDAGVQLIQGHGGRTDPARGRELIIKACSQKSALGCYGLGVIIRDGTAGETGGFAKAAPRFDEACNYGFGGGCNELGLFYMRGDGVAKNPVRAVELFEKACGMGAKYCRDLGLANEMGDGVLKNPKRARGLYDKACGAGNVSACNLLAYMKLAGDGGPKDVTGARTLFKQTCDAGDKDGCEGLREPE